MKVSLKSLVSLVATLALSGIASADAIQDHVKLMDAITAKLAAACSTAQSSELQNLCADLSQEANKTIAARKVADVVASAYMAQARTLLAQNGGSQTRLSDSSCTAKASVDAFTCKLQYEIGNDQGKTYLTLDVNATIDAQGGIKHSIASKKLLSVD